MFYSEQFQLFFKHSLKILHLLLFIFIITIYFCSTYANFAQKHVFKELINLQKYNCENIFQ